MGVLSGPGDGGEWVGKIKRIGACNDLFSSFGVLYVVLFNIPVKWWNSTEYPVLECCGELHLRNACPNGNLTGILVAPKYFQLFHRNQHEAGLSSCLLYQIKQLPPPKKCFSTRKFFFKSYQFVWVSLFFMQNAASSCVDKISHNSKISEQNWMPLCEIFLDSLQNNRVKNSTLSRRKPTICTDKKRGLSPWTVAGQLFG